MHGREAQGANIVNVSADSPMGARSWKPLQIPTPLMDVILAYFASKLVEFYRCDIHPSSSRAMLV